MTSEKFEQIVKDQFKLCYDILVSKNAEYTENNERLYIFKAAAVLQGISVKEALAGMMCKHTVSVYDMCRDNKPHSIEQWNEKITDSINYLLLLRAVIEESEETK